MTDYADVLCMEINFSESKYPFQINVSLDAETAELIKELRLRKVKLGPILRPALCKVVKDALLKLEQMEAPKAG